MWLQHRQLYVEVSTRPWNNQNAYKLFTILFILLLLASCISHYLSLLLAFTFIFLSALRLSFQCSYFLVSFTSLLSRLTCFLPSCVSRFLLCFLFLHIFFHFSPLFIALFQLSTVFLNRRSAANLYRPENFYKQRHFISCNWWKKVSPRMQK